MSGEKSKNVSFYNFGFYTSDLIPTADLQSGEIGSLPNDSEDQDLTRS